MHITKKSKIGIVGVGRVGTGIVQAFAQAGFEVSGIEIDQTNIDRAMTKIVRNLEMLLSKGKLGPGEKDVILSRITFETGFRLNKNITTTY